MLKKSDVNISILDSVLDKAISSLPKVEGAEKQFLTNDANKALAQAKKMLKDFGDEYISIELLLLGILRGKDKGAIILKDLGATEKSLKAAIVELRKGKRITDQNADGQYNALNKFAINLNERAESGKLDPIIGRDEEIRRVLHILSRRKKNNPIIIGEAGVGKRPL